MATWKKIIVSGSSISQLTNDANLIYSNSADVNLTGSFSGSFIGDGSGLSGVTTDITALNAHTASVDAFTGSIDGEVTALMASTGSVYSHVTGLLSATGSNYDHITNLNSFTGSFSSSVASEIKALEDFSSSLDAGFVTEAELVAATASLSASLATDIATNVADITTLNTFSSSLESTIYNYTGSFAGDGSALENITVTQNATVTASFTNATTASIVHNFGSDNVIVTVYDSSNQQFIPSTIWTKTDDEVEIHFEGTETGRAVVARGGHIVSGSIPYENLIAVPADIISGSDQLNQVSGVAATISGSFTLTSASIATDIKALEDFSSSLDDTFATDAQVNTATASLSSSLATDIASNLASITATDGEVTALMASTGSNYDHITNLLTYTGSAARKVAISGSITEFSASVATDLNNLSQTLKITGSDATTSTVDLKTQGLTFAGTSNEIETTVSGQTVTIGLPDSVTIAQDLTVTGNFTVSGTQTIVDSTTVDIGDNIIALNGTGATKGGLAVNDGPDSGSLLWDGDNDYWIAGPSGSETKIFVAGATGDGLLSGSAQIASDISGSITIFSSSIAGRVSTEETNVDVLQSHVGNIHAFTSSADGEITALMAFTASAARATAITGSFTLLSASIAEDIAGVSAGALESGSFAVTLKHDTGSIAFTEGLEIGDVYDLGNGTTDIRVPAGADWLELNYADTDFIWLDGTDAGITLDNNYEWRFYGATGTFIGPGEIRGETISGSIIKAAGGELLSGSDQLATIANVATTISGSSTVLSSSLATRVTAQENFSSSLTSTFATDAEVNTATASLSASLAVDIIANENSITALDGEVTNLMAATGSVYSHVSGLLSATGSNYDHITNLNSFTGSFSSSVATEIAALEAFSSSLDASYVTEAELVAATASLSASLAVDIIANENSITALDGEVTNLMASTGSVYSHVTGILSATSSYATKTGLGLLSGSTLSSAGQGLVTLTTNLDAGTQVDLGLDTTDSPTFAGLTVNGDLVVTGNTVEAQVTNLNIEDKYILLNSGSTSGDSGIVFGGADGVANSGVGLFWDTSYNSNDGRLGIVNSIAAGATGDQTPSYHIAGVYEGTEANAATAQADHVGNIRVESGEIYIYV